MPNRQLVDTETVITRRMRQVETKTGLPIREAVRQVRARHSNDLEAALELGIDRATLWTWRKVLGIEEVA